MCVYLSFSFFFLFNLGDNRRKNFKLSDTLSHSFHLFTYYLSYLWQCCDCHVVLGGRLYMVLCLHYEHYLLKAHVLHYVR